MIKKLLSKFRKNPKRDLPTEHCYTFEDGKRLYTYKGEYFQEISSRYYRSVQEAFNYLLLYNAPKEEVETMLRNIEDSTAQVIANLHKPTLAAKSATDVMGMVKQLRSQQAGALKASMTLLQSMFCMFYLLEDEKEGGYNEAYNAQKLALLETMPPEDRDFFLHNLKKALKL
jgi:hypothetical protein